MVFLLGGCTFTEIPTIAKLIWGMLYYSEWSPELTQMNAIGNTVSLSQRQRNSIMAPELLRRSKKIRRLFNIRAFDWIAREYG